MAQATETVQVPRYWKITVNPDECPSGAWELFRLTGLALLGFPGEAGERHYAVRNLKQVREGDWLVAYTPQEGSYTVGGVGRVTRGYREEQGPFDHPWSGPVRRSVAVEWHAGACGIEDLVKGGRFRRGKIPRLFDEILPAEFECIRERVMDPGSVASGALTPVREDRATSLALAVPFAASSAVPSEDPMASRSAPSQTARPDMHLPRAGAAVAPPGDEFRACSLEAQEPTRHPEPSIAEERREDGAAANWAEELTLQLASLFPRTTPDDAPVLPEAFAGDDDLSGAGLPEGEVEELCGLGRDGLTPAAPSDEVSLAASKAEIPDAEAREDSPEGLSIGAEPAMDPLIDLLMQMSSFHAGTDGHHPHVHEGRELSRFALDGRRETHALLHRAAEEASVAAPVDPTALEEPSPLAGRDSEPVNAGFLTAVRDSLNGPALAERTEVDLESDLPYLAEEDGQLALQFFPAGTLSAAPPGTEADLSEEKRWLELFRPLTEGAADSVQVEPFVPTVQGMTMEEQAALHQAREAQLLSNFSAPDAIGGGLEFGLPTVGENCACGESHLIAPRAGLTVQPFTVRVGTIGWSGTFRREVESGRPCSLLLRGPQYSFLNMAPPDTPLRGLPLFALFAIGAVAAPGKEALRSGATFIYRGRRPSGDFEIEVQPRCEAFVFNDVAEAGP